jgi:hypothetical protein
MDEPSTGRPRTPRRRLSAALDRTPVRRTGCSPTYATGARCFLQLIENRRTEFQRNEERNR